MSDVAIVGAGPAGLMAAERLATAGHAVTLYDAMPSPARKFLLAGRGGLNLTHSEPPERFLARYREAADRIAPMLANFSADDLRRWCAALGEETFVGSSGRVFPKSFKASPLLRAWLRRLAHQGVILKSAHRWTGFKGPRGLCFTTPDGDVVITPDAAILAMGGASWPRLGSTGAWASVLSAEDIAVAPLRPSNCGFRVVWSPFVRERFAGQPLKRIALTHDDTTMRGEAMITTEGLEGGAVYALSGPVREACLSEGEAILKLDLRPDLEAEALEALLSASRKGDSLANRLRKQAGLSPQAAAILRDAVEGIPTMNPQGLAHAIKGVPLRVTSVSGIERAISSAGGIKWNELDDSLMLKRRQGVFCAGEMIDWEAPTGGYLLQACFSTGLAAAVGADAWLRTQAPAAA